MVASVTPTSPAAPQSSRWPARLDVVQSLTGLGLALFMWAHMLFVASILLGKDAMWTVTRMFEGYFVFGRSYPILVSGVAALVIAALVVHAALALRKFPASYAQYVTFRRHAGSMRHADTTLWLWQVWTGFALFFLATVHVYTMLTRPDQIGPYASADRVWSDVLWPLYLVLLFAVEIHAGIGLYRLAVKWGWFSSANPDVSRRRLVRAKWAVTAFLIVLGLATLAAYIRIGIEHAPFYGERYLPDGYALEPDA
ncbi:MAG TPA: fumarate reductase cytochrome b subunit [Steroidobacteraceae bacterium]|nr:fumarate reductase cytochrome b subunit [Steroidobacteraceae bacterium]